MGEATDTPSTTTVFIMNSRGSEIEFSVSEAVKHLAAAKISILKSSRKMFVTTCPVEKVYAALQYPENWTDSPAVSYKIGPPRHKISGSPNA